MDGKDRQIILRIGGELARGGKVPIGLLADKLHAVQRLLYNVGSSFLGGGRRGVWKSEVLQACNLQFVEARAKCVEVVAEIAPQFQLTFPEQDLGRQSLNRMIATLESIKDKDRSRLYSYYPDFRQRSRVLKSGLSLLPEEESDYDIVLETTEASVALSSELRGYIKAVSREEAAEGFSSSIQTITGMLYLIEVATGRRRLGIIVHNRQIDCYYPVEYEETVRELIPGSLVEVEGFATLNDRGDIDRIEEIVDVRPVQLVPLYWSRIIHDRRFNLTKPLQIMPDILDGVWVHAYEPLGITAYGKSRSESLEAFRMEFSAIWDEYARESDENLTEDAKALKRALLDLVSSVEGV